MQTTEDVFYRLGKIILLPVVLGAVFLHMLGEAGIRSFPGCVFRHYTGLLCPGCGGTRAAVCLAQGRIWQAFLYHPFVVYVAAAYAIFMLLCFYRRHIRKTSCRAIRIEPIIYVGIGILLLQFVIKNVCLIVFHIRWI